MTRAEIVCQGWCRVGPAKVDRFGCPLAIPSVMTDDPEFKFWNQTHPSDPIWMYGSVWLCPKCSGRYLPRAQQMAVKRHLQERQLCNQATS